MKEVKVVIASNQDLYSQCLEIRRKVFIEEQGVPKDIEIDEHEDKAVHFLALVDGKPAGTGRLRLKKSYAKFERIASLRDYRGSGVGKGLMDFMQGYATREYPTYLQAMHAQESAVGFYKKLGWVQIGSEFHEAGIAHRVLIFLPKSQVMTKDLKAWTDPETREDIIAYLRTLT